MKISRHNKILELIANEAIDTQKGLLSKLREEGYDVTQATVSRDIREMGIHKVRAENGKYRYVSLSHKRGNQHVRKVRDHFLRVCADHRMRAEYRCRQVLHRHGQRGLRNI